MTLDEAKILILDHFTTAWGATSAITFENEDFKPDDEGGTKWIRVSVREMDSNQRTLGATGNRKFERLGSVFIQVFVKEGEGGTQQADVLAQTARGILEGTSSVTDVCFFVGRIITQEPDGYWHRVVVEVNFSYDETK